MAGGCGKVILSHHLEIHQYQAESASLSHSQEKAVRGERLQYERHILMYTFPSLISVAFNSGAVT